MRRSGNTTRIVDACVQELFTTGATTIVDHHPTTQASRFAFNVLVKRLMSEHGDMSQYVVDSSRLTIKRVDRKISNAERFLERINEDRKIRLRTMDGWPKYVWGIDPISQIIIMAIVSYVM